MGAAEVDLIGLHGSAQIAGDDFTPMRSAQFVLLLLEDQVMLGRTADELQVRCPLPFQIGECSGKEWPWR